MEPVLIWIDNDRISREKASLNNCIPLLQNLYNAFAEIDISVTIQDLVSLKHYYLHNNARNPRDFIEDFVVNQLVLTAGGYKINGLAVNEDRFKEMINLPDLTAIKAALKIFSEQSGSIMIDLITLINDTISKTPDADTRITSEATYYTKTDASAELSTDLLAIGQLLDSAKSKYKSWAITISPPNGLVFRGDSFGLDLTVIRTFEQKMAGQ